MIKVKLETWMDRVDGADEMGRAFTFRDVRIGHYFREGKYMTIECEYADLIPQAIRALAIEVGPSIATAVMRDVRIIP